MSKQICQQMSRLQAEALEAILHSERKSAKARDARQKLSEERLQRQVTQLQVDS